MKNTKKLYLFMMITEGLLFALGAFSLIFCYVNKLTSGNQNLLGRVYLIAHLVIVAGVFYYTFKAFANEPYIMKVFMIEDNNTPLKKSRIVAIVICAISLAIGLYFGLLSFDLPLPLSFFTKALRFALMNFGLTTGLLALYFIIFPSIYLKEEH